jgi:hypothetical protein
MKNGEIGGISAETTGQRTDPESASLRSVIPGYFDMTCQITDTARNDEMTKVSGP